MPKINITRGRGAPVLRRSDVAPGQVFAMKMRDGSHGRHYAHIGSNGRYYSVNLESGELSSAENGDKEVVLLGTFKYTISKHPAPGVVRECRRSQVRSGEVFNVKGGDKTYLALGAINKDLNGFLSVPLNNTENHAVTRNGDSNVRVTSTFTLDVTMAK